MGLTLRSAISCPPVLKKRVVVTGGAGFIGSHVVDVLLDAGHEVAILDDLSTGDRNNVNPAAAFYEIDITTPDVDRLLREIQPDAICHNAAQISVSAGQSRPLHDLNVNVAGSLRLIEFARQTGCRLVHASSAAVYGEPERTPVDEEHPTRPINNYGVSKLAVEHYLAAYARNYGLSYAALRYANVYGPRQSASGEAGVVAIFCEAVARGASVTIHGDGRQTRDFVFAGDVAAANAVAATSAASGVFNIGTGVETDVNSLFAAIAQAFGTGAEADHGPTRPGDIERSVLDPRRAEAVLEWRATVDLADGLRETVRWFLSQAGAR
jgi:UDP-glucose 4-epimerase